MGRWAVLLLVLAACEETAGQADAALDFDAAFDAAAVPDGAVVTRCTFLCGEPAFQDARTGATSFAPPGCGGSSFRLAWWHELHGIADAASVPVVSDVTADGVPDLAVTPRGVSSAWIFEGRERGFAQSPRVLAPPAESLGGWGLDLGDFSGDGLRDVVAGDQVAGAVAWRNREQGSLTAIRTGLPDALFSGAGLGDLSGDGLLDAVFGAAPPGTGFGIAFANGDGSWTSRAVAGLPVDGAVSNVTNAGYVAFADTDGDGDLDIFAFGNDEDTGAVRAFVFRNQGGGTVFASAGAFGPEGEMPFSSADPVQGSVGDVDCDGLPDIAVGGTIFLGDGTTWIGVTRVDDAIVSHLGDLDGDQDLDLVTHGERGVTAWRNTDSGRTWTEMPLGLPDATFVPPSLAGADPIPLAVPYGIDLLDVNGDGRLDLVRSYAATASGVSHSYLELWVRD